MPMQVKQEGTMWQTSIKGDFLKRSLNQYPYQYPTPASVSRPTFTFSTAPRQLDILYISLRFSVSGLASITRADLQPLKQTGCNQLEGGAPAIFHTTLQCI